MRLFSTEFLLLRRMWPSAATVLQRLLWHLSTHVGHTTAIKWRVANANRPFTSVSHKHVHFFLNESKLLKKSAYPSI